MKKALSLLLVGLLFCGTLTGCGNNDTAPAATETNSTVSTGCKAENVAVVCASKVGGLTYEETRTFPSSKTLSYTMDITNNNSVALQTFVVQVEYEVMYMVYTTSQKSHTELIRKTFTQSFYFAPSASGKPTGSTFYYYPSLDAGKTLSTTIEIDLDLIDLVMTAGYWDTEGYVDPGTTFEVSDGYMDYDGYPYTGTIYGYKKMCLVGNAYKARVVDDHLTAVAIDS